jgi:glutaredoxin
MMKTVLLLCSFLIVSLTDASEIYRSVDTGGTVQYSDRQADDAANAEKVRVGTEPAADEGLPYATRIAQQNFPVTFYITPDCGNVCTDARALLTQRGVPFSETKIITQEDSDAFRKDSGQDKVPSMRVGKTWVNGFLAKQWNDELDFAGYPKRAPYRTKPATSPPPTAQ